MSQQAPFALSKTLPKPASKKRWLLLFFTAMRPHQWVKNLFILVPLLFAKRLMDPSSLGHSLLAFAVFCCLSNALYIFNDWIDIEEDRSHPDKRNRPLTSGMLPVSVALSGSAILIFAAFALGSIIGINFLLIAALYFAQTLVYCLGLKRVIILDCIIIASGFVLRVVGGAVAISVAPTHWLIACAFLLALFLAFSKRRQELLVLSDNAVDHRKVLGEYSVAYLEQVNVILIGAVIVSYALYTVAPETIERFGTDALIYGTVFVIYGLLRYLALLNHPENGGNPSKMLVRDAPLLATVIGWSLYNALVIYYTSITASLASP